MSAVERQGGSESRAVCSEKGDCGNHKQWEKTREGRHGNERQRMSVSPYNQQDAGYNETSRRSF